MNHISTLAGSLVIHTCDGELLETPKQAAITCNVSSGHLGACRANPTHPLKFLKIGSHIFYRRDDLIDWNMSRQAKGAK